MTRCSRCGHPDPRILWEGAACSSCNQEFMQQERARVAQEPQAPRWNAFKGATCWEMYIGPLWVTWPFWSYLAIGVSPRVGWDREWRS